MEEQEEKKQYDNSPKIESIMTMSADGNYFIHKTIITDIKPKKYMDKVFAPKTTEEQVK